MTERISESVAKRQSLATEVTKLAFVFTLLCFELISDVLTRCLSTSTASYVVRIALMLFLVCVTYLALASLVPLVTSIFRVALNESKPRRYSAIQKYRDEALRNDIETTFLILGLSANDEKPPTNSHLRN